MPPKTKVLFISRKMNFAGAVRTLWDTIKVMDRSKFELHLLIDGPPDSARTMLEALDLQIHYMPLKKERFYLRKTIQWYPNKKSRQRAYKHILQAIQPDIIYFNTNGNLDLLEWSHGVNSKVVCHLHGVGEGLTCQGYDRKGQSKSVSARRRRLTKQIPHYYIACSLACKGVLQTSYNIPEERIQYFPESLDPASIQARPARVKAIREQYATSPDDLLLVCLGNFHFRKAPDILLSAYFKVLETIPNIKLMWVGAKSEGLKDVHYLAPFIDQIEQLIASGQLIATGHQEYPYDFLAAGDIFTLCSRDECLPLSILEAMSLKIPVVATDVGGVSEAIINRQTGLLAVSEDVDTISEYIIELAKSSELRNQFAQAAYQKVSQEYQVNTYIRQLEKSLLELTKLA